MAIKWGGGGGVVSNAHFHSFPYTALKFGKFKLVSSKMTFQNLGPNHVLVIYLT